MKDSDLLKRCWPSNSYQPDSQRQPQENRGLQLRHGVCKRLGRHLLFNCRFKELSHD
ncbi:hypothetical protein JFV28_22845 [Pseudomonas sp. TH05]|uniref:hypothetical protein n=1 Tax=unclassified Pseudomonas TaxID=196821 RepID=UPI001911742A|nr:MULTISPECIES: hypothetical protein [unclassified Pseudomonas]MBK5541178.1 hypothetical protein [Pseudomonas sp. TH07]MBK5558671.1 hypothetical protein [Pseudomonas sp. TH05]